MGNSHSPNEDISLVYVLTFENQGYAESFERKCNGFINTSSGRGVNSDRIISERNGAMGVKRTRRECEVQLVRRVYLAELMGFLIKESSHAVWRTEYPEAQRGRLNSTVRMGELEREVRSLTESLGKEEERSNEGAKKYRALMEDYTLRGREYSNLHSANTGLQSRVGELEEERRNDLAKVKDLEEALLQADPFHEAIKEFADLEERWKEVRKILEGHELEKILAMTKEGKEAYLRAQLSNYNDIETLGGRQAVSAARGLSFEETEVYNAEKPSRLKAEEVFSYLDRLKNYFKEDGTVENTRVAAAELDIPELLLTTVYHATKEKIPEAEAIRVRIQEQKVFHERRQELATSIAKIERMYDSITEISQRVEQAVGEARTATLEVKLLGEDEGRFVFEGRLPIKREEKETELARTLQLCMLATITDTENFNGLEFEEKEGKVVSYRFILPKREDQNPLDTTHRLAERMTALLGNTDFGLAGGKLCIAYTGIIGKIPQVRSEQGTSVLGVKKGVVLSR